MLVKYVKSSNFKIRIGSQNVWTVRANDLGPLFPFWCYGHLKFYWLDVMHSCSNRGLHHLMLVYMRISREKMIVWISYSAVGLKDILGGYLDGWTHLIWLPPAKQEEEEEENGDKRTKNSPKGKQTWLLNYSSECWENAKRKTINIFGSGLNSLVLFLVLVLKIHFKAITTTRAEYSVRLSVDPRQADHNPICSDFGPFSAIPKAMGWLQWTITFLKKRSLKLHDKLEYGLISVMAWTTSLNFLKIIWSTTSGLIVLSIENKNEIIPENEEQHIPCVPTYFTAKEIPTTQKLNILVDIQ